MKTVVSISTVYSVWKLLYVNSVYSVWKLLYLLVLCAVNADCCVLWWQVSTCTWKPQIVTMVTVPGCTVHLWHQETRSVSASGTTCMAKVGALLSVGKVDRHVSGWQLYVLHTPPLPHPHTLACTDTCTHMYCICIQILVHMHAHAQEENKIFCLFLLFLLLSACLH